MSSTWAAAGGAGVEEEAARAMHMEMLTSVAPAGDDQGRAAAALTQSYHHAFQGFAAELTEAEAAALSGPATANHHPIHCS